MTFLPRVLAAIQTMMTAALPREGVGLLGGREAGPGRRLLVAAFEPMANRASGDDRFEIAPTEFLAGVSRMEARGLWFLGFVHSHPEGTAALSSRDRRELWAQHLQMIVAPQRDGRCPAAVHWRTGDEWSSLPLPHLAQPRAAEQ